VSRSRSCPFSSQAPPLQALASGQQVQSRRSRWHANRASIASTLATPPRAGYSTAKEDASMQHRSPGRMCLTDLWRPEAWRSARVLRSLPKTKARRWRPPPGAAQRAPSCRSTPQFGSTGGLFVPKPCTGAGCQGRRTPDLGRGVHRCPPASVAGRGGSYLLGYSAPARSAGGWSVSRARMLLGSKA
jgi:hypothetical protein